MGSRREDVWTKLHELGPSGNEFSNYQDQFGFSDLQSELEKAYAGQEAKIKRQATEDKLTEQGNNAARMASQGITGGAILNDANTGIAADVGKRKFNVLGDLGIAKSNANMGLMKLINDMKFRNTAAKQNQDNTITGQQFNKAGMLQGAVNDWENMDIQHDNQPGALDDIFSGAQMLAEVASIPMTGGASATAGAGTSLLGKILGK